jgi:small subunit ribosomal protein S21
MSVVVKENESIDAAWRRFMRELISNGVLDEMKERAYFRKPSEIKAEVRRQFKKRKRRHSRAVRKSKSKLL